MPEALPIVDLWNRYIAARQDFHHPFSLIMPLQSCFREEGFSFLAFDGSRKRKMRPKVSE